MNELRCYELIGKKDTFLSEAASQIGRATEKKTSEYCFNTGNDTTLKENDGAATNAARNAQKNKVTSHMNCPEHKLY